MTEIEKLIQAMHDELCRCGEWCQGAEADYASFRDWVVARWGSSYPMEYYLNGVRMDASTDHE